MRHTQSAAVARWPLRGASCGWRETFRRGWGRRSAVGEGSYTTERPTPTMGASSLVVDPQTPTAVAVGAVGGGCDAPPAFSCRSALAVAVGLL
jgi:hypothetical protein